MSLTLSKRPRLLDKQEATLPVKKAKKRATAKRATVATRVRNALKGLAKT